MSYYIAKAPWSQVILPTPYGIHVRVKLKSLYNYRGYMASGKPQETLRNLKKALKIPGSE